MKKLLLFSMVIIVLLFSCGDKNKAIDTPVIEESELQAMTKMLPTELKTIGSKTAVFKDINNKLFKVKVTVDTINSILNIYGIDRKVTKHTVTYKDEEHKVTTEISIENTYYNILFSQMLAIRHTEVSTTSFGLTLFYDFDKKGINHTWISPLPTYEQYELSFKNVYADTKNNVSQYKGLKFGFDYGIVTYADKAGNSFVFHHFE